MWGYYWGYTAAQLELMSVDCPIVVYGRDKPNKGKGKANDRFARASASDIMEKAKQWQEKYGSGDCRVEIDLRGFRQ